MKNCVANLKNLVLLLFIHLFQTDISFTRCPIVGSLVVFQMGYVYKKEWGDLTWVCHERKGVFTDMLTWTVKTRSIYSSQSVLVRGWCDRQMKDWSTGNNFWWLLRSGCCSLLDATDLVAFPLTEQIHSFAAFIHFVFIFILFRKGLGACVILSFVLILVFSFFELNTCKVSKYQYGHIFFSFFYLPLGLWCKIYFDHWWLIGF